MLNRGGSKHGGCFGGVFLLMINYVAFTFLNNTDLIAYAQLTAIRKIHNISDLI
jgi:hypothetical protein